MPVQPASNSCWTVVDQLSNYAYTCDFSVYPVSGKNSEELLNAVFSRATTHFSTYFPFKGCGQVLRVGATCDLFGGKGEPVAAAPIRVLAVGGHSFTFLALPGPGHPEGAGRTITFTFVVKGGQLRLQVSAQGKPGLLSKPSLNIGVVTQTWGTYATRGLRSMFTAN
ncbi:hypothetical protein [Streptomyces sp. NPDC056323]|uniref:hypothetical protein n=1 Tax=Streptomyces sp. NPDC056323 TaxID=3345784 RepID=UPI0035E36171